MKRVLIGLIFLMIGVFSVEKVSAGSDLRTGISYFTFTEAMDTAGTARSLIRNDTLYTPWLFVGNYKRLRIAVQRIPYPMTGYKDTSWSTNVNDTTKFLIQHAFSPNSQWNPNNGDVPNRVIPVDSSLTNSAVIDTTVLFTAAQCNLFHRDSVAVLGDWIRGVVVIHDSTKTTIASSGLVGNKYARQFLFWINGLQYRNQ